MNQPRLITTGRDKPRPGPPIQFYSVQIMPLADGGMSVGMSATVCEPLPDDGFELVNLEVASARVDSLDDVLVVIREAVVAATFAN